MSGSGRVDRVAELIREEVAKLLTRGLKDPRIGFVSVMGVKMSTDLHYADVYVSLYGEEKERKSSMIALRNSQGWVRREVGKILRLRVVPEIRFRADDSLDKVYELEKVFEAIHEEQRSMPMLRIDLPQLAEELRGGNSFLITSHVNPDGDAIGSVLALAELLRAMGKKKISCAFSDPIPQAYASMPGAKKILGPDSEVPEFDTAVVVDVCSFDRVGAIAEWIPDGCKTLILDHHLHDSPDGTSGFIDPTYAAAGEMVVELFEAAELPMSPKAAYCACVAQVTDTGGYRFGNTNARSHRIAAKFYEAEIDVTGIGRQFFETMSMPKIQLLGVFLERLEFIADNRAAWSWVSDADIEAAGGEREDLNGLVNYARNVRGVDVGVIFTIVDDNTTKVSFRSVKEFNSATFLEQFGGGGHAAAAGATIPEPYEKVRDAVLGKLREALETE